MQLQRWQSKKKYFLLTNCARLVRKYARWWLKMLPLLTERQAGLQLRCFTFPFLPPWEYTHPYPKASWEGMKSFIAVRSPRSFTAAGRPIMGACQASAHTCWTANGEKQQLMVTRSAPFKNKALRQMEVSGRGRSPARDQRDTTAFSASRHSLETGEAAAYTIPHNALAAATSFIIFRFTRHVTWSIWESCCCYCS